MYLDTARQHEEENKERRLRNMSTDQLLLKTNMTIDKVNEIIADTIGTEVREGKIVSESWGNESFSSVSILIFIVVLFIAGSVFGHNGDSFTEKFIGMYINDNALIISIVVAVVLGFLLARKAGFKEDENFYVYSEGSETKIQISVFDENGYRNIDKNELDKIIQRTKSVIIDI